MYLKIIFYCVTFRFASHYGHKPEIICWIYILYISLETNKMTGITKYVSSLGISKRYVFRCKAMNHINVRNFRNVGESLAKRRSIHDNLVWLRNKRSYYACFLSRAFHYDDVIMGAMAYQITSLTIVYSTVYSVEDQRKHQSSASLAFVRRIHRRPVIPRTNG